MTILQSGSTLESSPALQRWPMRYAGAGILLLLLAIGGVASAQERVQFNGALTTVGTGLYGPQGVVVEGSGNVFIADTGNNRVVEVPVGGGAEFEVGSGLNGPIQVSLNSFNDLFIADLGTDQVLEEVGGFQFSLGSGLSSPRGVVMDSFGNLYIADSGNNRVLEIPAGSSTEHTVGSGFSFPGGLAVDPAGDLFVTDIGNYRVVEIPAGGGSQITLPIPELRLPSAVALDADGDVYVVDGALEAVFELFAGTSTVTTLPIPGLSLPSGLTLDTAGDVYVADSDNNRIVELQRYIVNFGTVTLCSASSSCSETLTLNYFLNANTTFGPTKVLTDGAPNLDYALTSTTCKGWLHAGQTCTVTVTFTPTQNGLRSGAVKLFDSSNYELTVTPLRGFGAN
jgi:large repetitive protein